MPAVGTALASLGIQCHLAFLGEAEPKQKLRCQSGALSLAQGLVAEIDQ